MSENHNEDNKIVGTVNRCVNLDCTGWLVDSFSGKYWVRCQDPRHDQQPSSDGNNRREIELKEEVECGKGYEPSVHTVNHPKKHQGFQELRSQSGSNPSARLPRRTETL